MRTRLGGRGTAILVVLLVIGGPVVGTTAMSGDETPSGERVLNHTLERYANAESVVGTADITVRNASANASVDLLREDNDDGTPAYVLNVTHDNESDDWHATVWVAQNDSRLLRVVATDGPNRTVVDYRETRFNVSVHDSTFDPPADRVAVTGVDRYDTFDDAQANTSLNLPELDATFRDAAVVRRSDGVGVVQRYAAAGDNTTVVSTTFDYDFGAENATDVTVNGHPANVTTVRDRAIVYWHNDSVTTALTVEASEDRAVELAGRLSE